MSTFALISDIHSNTEALNAVFQRIGELGIEEVNCLGDVVGYGAEPGCWYYLWRAIEDYASAAVELRHPLARVSRRVLLLRGERIRPHSQRRLLPFLHLDPRGPRAPVAQASVSQ